MKLIDNYKNFDIKLSSAGNYFVYSDYNLSEYCDVRFNIKFKSLEDAKAAIDRYWNEQ